MEYLPNHNVVRPLQERTETQRENVTDLLAVLEEDAWYLTTRLREAQATVGRLFDMEDMLTGKKT